SSSLRGDLITLVALCRVCHCLIAPPHLHPPFGLPGRASSGTSARHKRTPSVARPSAAETGGQPFHGARTSLATAPGERHSKVKSTTAPSFDCTRSQLCFRCSC